MIALQRNICFGTLLALMVTPVPVALAQNYPTKPVTLVMP